MNIILLMLIPHTSPSFNCLIDIQLIISSRNYLLLGWCSIRILKVLGKSVGLCKTTKRKDQL